MGHLFFGDHRPGLWTFIGQVTCGSSDTWKGKIREPSEPMWKLLLNTGSSPVGFLAVPHHVEPAFLSKVVQDSDRLVLDRLRLARIPIPLAGDEAKLVRAVFDAGPEPVV